MYFYDENEVEKRELVPGVHARLIWGEKIMMGIIDIEPSAVVPAHSHPHEQTGYLVSGHMDFLVDGEHHTAKPGDNWNIAGDVEHSATALEESVVIEVFSPIREDYLPYYTPRE